MDKDKHDAANAAQLEEDRADHEYFGSINPADIGHADDSPENILNCGDPREARTEAEETEILKRFQLDGVLCAVEDCGRQAIREHYVVTLEEFTEYAKWPRFALCGEHSAQLEAVRVSDTEDREG